MGGLITPGAAPNVSCAPPQPYLRGHMNCPRCHGKGREILKTQFGQGHNPPITLNEISICVDCLGSGKAYCCDDAGENYSGEQKAEIMIEIAKEMEDAINPNEPA